MASKRAKNDKHEGRRSLSFGGLGEAVADARELEDGYLRVGQWSLGQCCEHLTSFMRFSLDGFPSRGLPPPLPFLMRTLLLNERKMRKPMPVGMPSPAFLRPAEEAGEGPRLEGASDADRRAVEKFSAVCKRVQNHAGDFKPSPLFGRLSPQKWRRVHAKHAEHHLSFLVPTSATIRDHRA